MPTYKQTSAIANGTRHGDKNTTATSDAAVKHLINRPNSLSRDVLQVSSTAIDDRNKHLHNEQSKTDTSKHVREFHPLSYLFTVCRGKLENDCHENGKPCFPSAIPGVLNRLMMQEYNAKIEKYEREVEEISKRIDGIHARVTSLHKEHRENTTGDASSSNLKNSGNTSGNNFGNEIYLLVRSIGMWTQRMETKTQLMKKIEWSKFILKALLEIDEKCNATMFWVYSTWRKLQYQIGPGGTDTGWNTTKDPYCERKYDCVESDSPELLRLFRLYEQAYRKNIEVTKLIRDNLGRSSSDEKLSRYIKDNYVDCKGCKALFSQRYEVFFGTRVEVPMNQLVVSKGGKSKKVNAKCQKNVTRFFCTDCIDAFNPSIMKKKKRDKERMAEKHLEELFQDDKQEQEVKSKSNKRRKKKKKKKTKRSSDMIISNEPQSADTCDPAGGQLPAEHDVVSIHLSTDGDESHKSLDDNDGERSEIKRSQAMTSSKDKYSDDDSKINDIWVDFLCRTGSIIALNAFMDEKLGVTVDLQ